MNKQHLKIENKYEFAKKLERKYLFQEMQGSKGRKINDWRNIYIR